MAESEQSIREMAENQGDEQGELFAGGILAGDDLSLLDLIKKGKGNVESTVSIRSAEFPTSNGLLQPTKEGQAIITYRWEKPELSPQWDNARDENAEIKGWKVRQILKPIAIESVTGEADAIQANFALLLDGAPDDAARLLDKLNEMAGAALSA